MMRRAKMVYCREIIRLMEEIAPPELAEDWDNIGLLAGSSDREVHKVMVCMDATLELVKEAVQKGTDMMVTHHPLIFKKLSRVVESDLKGRILSEVIRNGISLYSAHTNLDAAGRGVNEILAEKLGLSEIANTEGQYLKAGIYPKPLPFIEFIDTIKRSLGIKDIRLAGKPPEKVGKVAVFCGSFDDDLAAVKGLNADILVTGDVKYHTAVDAAGMGICIADAGHYATERVILDPLTEMIASRFKDIEVFTSSLETAPFITY